MTLIPGNKINEMTEVIAVQRKLIQHAEQDLARVTLRLQRYRAELEAMLEEQQRKGEQS